MLKLAQTLGSYHMQAALNSFDYLWRKPLATTMTVFVIAIALTLPAIFWIFSESFNQITANWQKNGRISLYLQGNVTEKETQDLLKQVQTMSGVGQALLKTAAENLEAIQRQEGMGNIIQYLPENPLPAVIEVMPSFTTATPGKTEHLYQQLKKLRHVEQAKLDMQWITKMHALLYFAEQLAHALMLLLALAVVFVVGNALRLAIQYSQEEIRVLKLIGAANAYVARPFLYSGIWYGLLGAIVAIILINMFMLSMTFPIQDIVAAYHTSFPFLGLSVKQAYCLVFIAILLSWIGAWFSVKRQLNTIEPYP